MIACAWGPRADPRHRARLLIFHNVFGLQGDDSNRSTHFRDGNFGSRARGQMLEDWLVYSAPCTILVRGKNTSVGWKVQPDRIAVSVTSPAARKIQRKPDHGPAAGA